MATVLSHDMENDPDIVALIGCSAALTLSGIPFFGPVGAARVGFIDGAYVLNPTLDQMKGFKLDLVVAGTAEGVLMVESEAHELDEATMLGAVEFGTRRVPARDPGDHRAGRARRQGAVGHAGAGARDGHAYHPPGRGGPREHRRSLQGSASSRPARRR